MNNVVDTTREERLDRLLKKARSLPGVPGVYLMKDAQGTVVYVGKARALPDRVSSYFVPSAELGFKKQPLLDIVDDFDVIECEGEWEALLTESRLIKDLRPAPKFNARLKDGKSFPYLVITQNEDYPRVFVTRNPSGAGDEALTRLLKAAKVYGPFTNAGALREAVQLLQRAFKFRTCSIDIVAGDPRNRFFRPCLLAAINQCTAPCAERIGVEEYGADVQRFARFVSSKRSAMLRELRSEMDTASGLMQYEKAASVRDQIRSIEKLDERAEVKEGWQPEIEIAALDPAKGCAALQKILGLERAVRAIEGIDIAHLQGGQTVGSKVCFVDGRPFKEEYRRYKIRSVANDDYASIREVVSRRYRDAGAGHELFPDVIMIDGGLGQLHAAEEALAQLEIQPPMVISLAKKEELIYVRARSEPIRLARTNAALRLVQSVRDEAHRFAQSYHHLLRKKDLLD